MKKKIAVALSLILLFMNNAALAAEDADPQGTLELRGTVIDKTRAYLPAVPVTLDDQKGNKYTATTDEKGQYRFTGIKPGVYTITVEAEGFATFTGQIDLTARRTTPFDITLEVTVAEKVDVRNDDATISSDPDQNLTAIRLTGKDLEALPDDPDELLETLRQMAGATGDATVYVGGFRERGQLPPKEAIQMIRINANPYSAEFSEPGFARIEIITKPGADTFHGSFRFNFNDESLNARNPSQSFRAPTQNRNYSGNFTGPIIRNRWGFFFNLDRRASDENSFINAVVLDPVTLQPTQFNDTVLNPGRNTNFDFRTDYLMTKKHTLGVGYRFSKRESENEGIGSFDLPERAYNTERREDTLRLSLTTIATEHAVNELRLQLSRRTNLSEAISDAPAIIVLDAFNSGGNQGSLFNQNKEQSIDFTDNVTYTHGKHVIKLGFRAEADYTEYINRSNFGGTFTFSSLDQYRRALQGDTSARPSQFSINRGDPFVSLSQWEMGYFIQDDWRINPRMTLSYGLRHEFQTNLDDKMNFAPRVGLAWADKKQRTTLRLGAGIFYNYLSDNITFDTIRFDGQHQLQYTIPFPSFFPDIPTSGGSQRQPTIRIKDAHLNDPYTINTTVSVDRQLPWKMVGSVAYTWTRGVHLLRTRNINAPTRDGNGDAVFPFPGQGPILAYESTGFSKRNELRFNLRTGINPKLTLFGFYTLSFTKSDTDGAGTQPANPFDLSTEYGRASQDSRHFAVVGGSFTLPHGFRISPHFNVRSGGPFNITTGRDNNLDLSFSDRPAFANPGDPGAVVTRFGVFNPNPRPGDVIIPRNFGEGPGSVSLNLNVSKTFGFGPERGGFPGQARNGNQQGQNQQGQNQQGQNQPRGDRGGDRGGRGGGGGGGFGGGRGGGGFGGGGFGGGGFGGGGFGGGGGGFFGGDSAKKYTMTISVNVQNLLNHPIEPRYNGVLTSPLFGLANSKVGSRRIDLSLAFRF
jgi:hypothetical protein